MSSVVAIRNWIFFKCKRFAFVIICISCFLYMLSRSHLFSEIVQDNQTGFYMLPYKQRRINAHVTSWWWRRHMGVDMKLFWSLVPSVYSADVQRTRSTRLKWPNKIDEIWGDLIFYNILTKLPCYGIYKLMINWPQWRHIYPHYSASSFFKKKWGGGLI